MKVLFISGSPRKGNIDLIFNKIKDSLKGINSDEVLLRDRNISHCKGCLFCDENKRCSIDDGMKEINDKLLNADILIIGTPNYFDNVPGLMKDFIDRTNPFYQTDKLKDKKAINIIIGGGGKENSKKVIQVLNAFTDAQKIKTISNYIFQGLAIGEVLNDEDFEENIDNIVKDIKSLLK